MITFEKSKLVEIDIDVNESVPDIFEAAYFFIKDSCKSIPKSTAFVVVSSSLNKIYRNKFNQLLESEDYMGRISPSFFKYTAINALSSFLSIKFKTEGAAITILRLENIELILAALFESVSCIIILSIDIKLNDNLNSRAELKLCCINKTLEKYKR